MHSNGIVLYSTMVLYGVIKFFDIKRGFGFVVVEGKENLEVRARMLTCLFDTL